MNSIDIDAFQAGVIVGAIVVGGLLLKGGSMLVTAIIARKNGNGKKNGKPISNGEETTHREILETVYEVRNEQRLNHKEYEASFKELVKCQCESNGYLKDIRDLLLIANADRKTGNRWNKTRKG
jgi:hypothetical protein